MATSAGTESRSGEADICFGPVVALSVLVIAAQSVASRLWLRRFRYGPFEWLWRMGTWWTWIPLTRRAQPRTVEVLSS